VTVLVVQRGCEFKFQWPVFQPDGTTPMDLTGWTASGWIRSVYADEFQVPDASPWFDFATPGAVTLTVPGPTSEAWSWERGVFSFTLADAAERAARLDSGLVLATFF
jgi:hypothetical protein